MLDIDSQQVEEPAAQREAKDVWLLPFKSISEKLKTDIILYEGKISHEGMRALFNKTETPLNDNIFFILNTTGGESNAAFKIARRLQEKYKHFYLYVFGQCKSAGTLIAIGSDEIIMSDIAEFGPLDIQLKEKDEIWKYNSGLNIQESLNVLKAETLRFFRQILVELVGTGLSTKTAAEIATKLALGFITPIASQIDPVKVGENQRAINIALAYGERLIKNNRGNLPPDYNGPLVTLVQAYTEHSFVIDYNEAAGIFKSVRLENQLEKEAGKALYERRSTGTEEPALVYKFFWEKENETASDKRND